MASADALPANDRQTATAPTVALPKRRLSRVVAADAVALGDFSAVVLGGLAPALVFGYIGELPIDRVAMLQSTMIAGLLCYLCLRLRGMYDTSRMAEFPDDPVELMIAVACGMLGVLGIGIPLALRSIDLFVWYAAWMSASYMLILFNRLAAQRLFARLAAAGRFDQRIAVFGAGGIARRVRDYLASPGLGIYFAGVYDDRADSARVNPEGLSVDGRLDDLVSACRKGRVDRIIVALPPSAEQRLAAVVERFERLPVSTHIVTHIASDLVHVESAANVSSLGPIGLLDVKKKA